MNPLSDLERLVAAIHQRADIAPTLKYMPIAFATANAIAGSGKDVLSSHLPVREIRLRRSGQAIRPCP